MSNHWIFEVIVVIIPDRKDKSLRQVEFENKNKVAELLIKGREGEWRLGIRNMEQWISRQTGMDFDKGGKQALNSGTRTAGNLGAWA